MQSHFLFYCNDVLQLCLSIWYLHRVRKAKEASVLILMARSSVAGVHTPTFCCRSENNLSSLSVSHSHLRQELGLVLLLITTEGREALSCVWHIDWLSVQVDLKDLPRDPTLFLGAHEVDPHRLDVP